MKDHLDCQQTILELLESDISAGTAALFETYGGLVWSTCAWRLTNPEDIRECVNDTFFAFISGYQKFDPEKGSLRNYLCTIALRRATERYRKNQAVERAEEEYRIHIPLFTTETADSIDLTEALAKLDPVDARILREKYYDGMTYQQIAESLGLPYDTVKKRGQRNLKKLRAILIGLILALLAAGCAYMIYRSYQFAEGAGPNFDPDRPIYQISAVDDGSYVLEAYTYFVENVIYQDGQLYAKIGILSNRPDGQDVQSEAQMQANMRLQRMLNLFTRVRFFDDHGNFAVASCSSHLDGAGKGTLELIADWAPAQLDNSLTVQIRMDIDDLPRDMLKEGYAGILTDADIDKLEQATPSWTVTLEKVDFTDDEHEEGTFYTYLDTGFMVRDGVSYSGGIHVSLYPYQTESVYILSDMLLHNYSGCYDDRSVTLTAEDGTVYSADQIRGASVSPLHERDIFFPGADAGECVLTIPYLCVIREDQTQTVTISVPTQVGQVLPLDETVSFSDGSQIHLKGIRLECRTVEGFITGDDGSAIPQQMLEWDYIVECEPVPAEAPELIGARGIGTLNAEGTELTLAVGGDVIGPGSRELTLTVSQANYGHREYEEGGAYMLSLTFDAPTYILDQQIEIPVNVYESGYAPGQKEDE